MHDLATELTLLEREDRWDAEYVAHVTDPFNVAPPVRTNRAYRGWRQSCVTLKDFD